MALPAFATIDDLEARVGDVVTPVRAQALLDAASTLVRSYVGRTWVDDDGELHADVPDALREVTLNVVERVLAGPSEGVANERIGDAGIGYFDGATGFRLSDTDKMMLASTMATSGLSSIRVVAPRLAAGVPVPAPWWDDEDDGS